MGEVTLYRFSDSLKIVEEGICSLPRALQELELSSLNAALHRDSGEDAVRVTSFGLSRSDADFIEVSFAKPDVAAVHSDRLHFPSKLARIFARKGHFWIEGTKDDTKRVIQSYFDLSREEFEARYVSSLCR